jgi:hypothetical protein
VHEAAAAAGSAAAHKNTHTHTHTHTQHQCGELKRCNLFSSFHVQNLKIGWIFIKEEAEEEEEEDYY